MTSDSSKPNFPYNPDLRKWLKSDELIKKWDTASEEANSVRNSIIEIRGEFGGIVGKDQELMYFHKLAEEYMNIPELKGKDLTQYASIHTLLISTPYDASKLLPDLEGDLSVVEFLNKKLKDLKEHVKLREEIESKVFKLRDALEKKFLDKGFDAKIARTKVNEIVRNYQSAGLSEGITDKLLAKSVAFHALIGGSISEVDSVELPVGTKTDLSVIIYLEDQIDKLKS